MELGNCLTVWAVSGVQIQKAARLENQFSGKTFVQVGEGGVGAGRAIGEFLLARSGRILIRGLRDLELR